MSKIAATAVVPPRRSMIVEASVSESIPHILGAPNATCQGIPKSTAVRLAYMSTLATRVLQALQESGHSQVELARACAIKPASVHDWTSGKTMSLKAATAQRAAAFLGVSMLWLTEGRGPMREAATGTAAQAPAGLIEPGSEFVTIRRARLKLQAGASGYAIEYLDGDSLPIFFRADWFQDKGYKPSRCVALKVAGSSMEPSLYEGDIVVINLEDTTPADGVAFAANYEGEAVIKRLRRDSGEWWLASDNPDKVRYRDKKCTDDVTLVGRVIYKQSECI